MRTGGFWVVGFTFLQPVTPPTPVQELKPLEVTADFEGANPQSSGGILRETPRRFRLRPVNEEGATPSYYFRFNTKVLNHTSQEQDIELIVEWPLLKDHPDYEYDTYYYGDIGRWKWTYANIEGIEARIHISVPPGETYVGFFPKYGYQDLERYLSRLPSTPGLEKWVEGKSHQGRNIWALEISDPDARAGNRIFVSAVIHPYESSGSYISEAIIDFLLSGDPAARQILRDSLVYLLPMVNPDGVALGMSELTRPNGVDVIRPGSADLSSGVVSDEPAVRTLVDFVQKIRPDIWLDVHSWPHQDDDGLWYITDEWVAEAFLKVIPDGTFQEYVWNLWKAAERPVPANNLWHWVTVNRITAGAVPSISWYRRSEEDVREIGLSLIKALGYALTIRPDAAIRTE